MSFRESLASVVWLIVSGLITDFLDIRFNAFFNNDGIRNIKCSAVRANQPG